jgi:hypothetical protein
MPNGSSYNLAMAFEGVKLLIVVNLATIENIQSSHN